MLSLVTETPDGLYCPAGDFHIDAWRGVVGQAQRWGIPVPGLSSALAYLEGYRSPRLPSNLVQAQRDYFGAHTYERIDQPRGKFFHTDWTGHGGATTSRSYSA